MDGRQDVGDLICIHWNRILPAEVAESIEVQDEEGARLETLSLQKHGFNNGSLI